jgi:hypothetical protein
MVVTLSGQGNQFGASRLEGLGDSPRSLAGMSKQPKRLSYAIHHDPTLFARVVPPVCFGNLSPE